MGVDGIHPSAASSSMKPRDKVAFIIAIGLVTWGALMILGLAWRNKSVTEAGGEILLAVAGGLSASLAAYFATRNNHK